MPHALPPLALLLAFVVSTAPLVAQDDDPAAARTVREALLRLAKRSEPELSLGSVRSQLDVYALELGEELGKATNGRERAATIARYFFATPLLAPAKDLADPENFYVHRVLAGRQGFCLALSAIVLATGEKLGLPLYGVAAPRHFFVRYDDGTTVVNIETTEGGRAIPDEEYRSLGITKKAEREGLFLRKLTTPEVIAHLLNNEGYLLWKRGDAEGAAARFTTALGLHPGLVEAHINLGVALATEGKSDAAAAHFDRVLDWMPKDAPVLLNRALSALRAGNTLDALTDIEAAVALDPKSPELRGAREVVYATILREDRWRAHQAEISRRAAALRAAKKLPRGLLGAYFRTPEPTGTPLLRVDPEVSFEWRWNAPDPSLPADGFSVRWDGYVELPEAGVWTFLTAANDGVRVFVDGIRIIDNWKRNEGALDQESLKLEAGLHALRVDFVDYERFAGITLRVKRADASSALGPPSFFHAER